MSQLTHGHVCDLNVITAQNARQYFAYTKDVEYGNTLSWSGISRSDGTGPAEFHCIQERRGIASCREIISHPVEVEKRVFCFGTNAVRKVDQGGSNTPFVGVRRNGLKV